jgi:hypothetical protein
MCGYRIIKPCICINIFCNVLIFEQLGSEKMIIEEVGDNWWQQGFNVALKKANSKKKKKRAKNDDDGDLDNPTFDDLYKATGGARLGMRARAKQPGKLKRTEDVIDNQEDVQIIADKSTIINDEVESEKPKKKKKKLDKE